MMEVKEPCKPKVNPRARATAEIDVIPPEVFAVRGGFLRPKAKNENLLHRRNVIETKKDERPIVPRRIDSVLSRKALSSHVNKRRGTVNDGVADTEDMNEEHKTSAKFESDHQNDSILPLKKVEVPSLRARMTRDMSEITLNASQHPEQTEDIVLSPLHKNKAKKSVISPQRKLIPSVLCQMYPDFEPSESGVGGRPYVSFQASGDESVLSSLDYDGFEEDSYGDHADVNVSMRSQLSHLSARTPTLSPLAEEEDSEQESGGAFSKNKRPSVAFFPWPKRQISSTPAVAEKTMDGASKKPRGTTFRMPTFKKISIRGRFSTMKLRDGTVVGRA
ncbi:unnamed protein product [Cylindrotheca closterium]|uniref:Uncharacterized protein n=1 Tax=Cylindrotheca closterium TaxID=2856 RepID=A0AAD2JPW7_9STRA|nr:unnamed protein product [Cylindrotheca closterium]